MWGKRSGRSCRSTMLEFLGISSKAGTTGRHGYAGSVGHDQKASETSPCPAVPFLTQTQQWPRQQITPSMPAWGSPELHSQLPKCYFPFLSGWSHITVTGSSIILSRRGSISTAVCSRLNSSHQRLKVHFAQFQTPETEGQDPLNLCCIRCAVMGTAVSGVRLY